MARLVPDLTIVSQIIINVSLLAYQKALDHNLEPDTNECYLSS